jgi:hypothetical protein
MAPLTPKPENYEAVKPANGSAEELQARAGIAASLGADVRPAPAVILPRATAKVSSLGQFLFIICATLLITAAGSHFVAHWIGLPKPGAAYRRIGPATGPQVFCAGSSLLQFGLSWPEISKILGQGMENWGVGGSSPSEWEVSQLAATNVNLMIIGVSIYDSNEYHLGNARANIAPLTQTISDLWRSGQSWSFSKRLLSQYPLAYLREIFPTAGNADAVLVGLRRKLPTGMRSSAAAEDRANSLVVPKDAVMEFGGSTDKMSAWPTAKILRRMALMRSETQGQHAFNGPKQLAFRRMLTREQEHGSNVVVVLPVSPTYTKEFLTPDIQQQFEQSLAEVQREFPQARFVRLDQVTALQSDEYFSDPVHLNGAGRDLATAAFLKTLNLPPAQP